MIKIDINTDLEKYVLIDRVTETNECEIQGSVTHQNAPLYTGLESLAQLASMHVKWLHDFKKHAALLKIINIEFNESNQLNGNFLIMGKLTARSGRAFTYSLQSSINGDIKIKGSIIITLIDYDDKFKKEILEEHYKKLFSCLTKR